MIEKYRSRILVEATQFINTESIKYLKELGGNRIKIEDNDVFIYFPQFDIDVPIKSGEWLVKFDHDSFEVMTNEEFLEKYEDLPPVDGTPVRSAKDWYDWLNRLNSNYYPYNIYTTLTGGDSHNLYGTLQSDDSSSPSSSITYQPMANSPISSNSIIVDDIASSALVDTSHSLSEKVNELQEKIDSLTDKLSSWKIEENIE